ncbi:MAG: hypothetical protein EBZ99_03730 [Actinobacteria bacterium]|nr:hypothetical protein [Actinomycetota bacterium]
MDKGQKKVGKVMREFKKGELHSGKSGKIVKNPKQAIAIALSEAGMSRKKMATGGSVTQSSSESRSAYGTQVDFSQFTNWWSKRNVTRKKKTSEVVLIHDSNVRSCCTSCKDFI